MPPNAVPPASDPIRPAPSTQIRITVDGVDFRGAAGQTIAGVLLGSGTLSWRHTSDAGAPRGVFCGIGVCFDCVAVVNGRPDVRTCQRRACDGDVVATQHDPLPAAPGAGGGVDG